VEGTVFFTDPGCGSWAFCWFECNCVRVSGVVVCDTDPYMYVRDVSVVIMCMYDMSDICSWEMTVIGCGVFFLCFCLCRSISQCVCCVDLGGVYVLVVVCVLI